MSANKIVTNHLMELPIGMAVDQESEPGDSQHNPAPTEKADDPGNATNTDDQFPMALFNGC